MEGTDQPAARDAAQRRTRRQTIYLRQPSEAALQAAEEAAYGGRGDARIRRGFARRPKDIDPSVAPLPPLARMMGAQERGSSGRGGEMRLKTYLTIHWLNSTKPDSSHPAQDYADLLDAERPAGVPIDDAASVTDSGGVREVSSRNGKQRVSRAIRWLAANDFVSLDEVGHRRGREATVTLLSDLGDGAPFTRPDGGKGGDGTSIRSDDWYFTIPVGMWTKGWISALSGPALTVLIVYLDNWNPKRGETYIAGKRRVERYGISETTMRRGSAELHAYGLATVIVGARLRFSNSRQSVTKYTLHLDRFGERVSPREDCPSEIRGYRIHDLGPQVHLQ